MDAASLQTRFLLIVTRVGPPTSCRCLGEEMVATGVVKGSKSPSSWAVMILVENALTVTSPVVPRVPGTWDMLTSWVLASYEIQIHALATHELVIHFFGSVFDRKGVDSVEAQIIVATPLTPWE